MTTTFKIKYETVWGESLALVLQDKKHPMNWGDGAIWSVTVKDCPAAALKDYTYVVMRDGLIVRTEWSHHSAKSAREITDASVVASGGAGTMEHFAEAAEAGADVLLAASVFHFHVIGIPELKAFLASRGLPVRT